MGRVFFAGLSCSAGYPEAPVTRWMTGANCSAGAWSGWGSASCCLVKVAWSCSFLLARGAGLGCRHPAASDSPWWCIERPLCVPQCHKVLSTLLLLTSLTAEAVQDPASHTGQCLAAALPGLLTFRCSQSVLQLRRPHTQPFLCS